MVAVANYQVMIDFVSKMNGKEVSGTSGKAIAQPFKNLEKQIQDTGNALSTKVIPPQLTLNKALNDLKSIDSFKKLGTNAGVFDDQLRQISNSVSAVGGNFGMLQKQAVKMNQSFDMSMLSMMFFGMFLQRTFGGLFNQMLNTFKMVDSKGMMPLNKSLNKLQAAWTFLSFSVIKALEPLMLPILESVIGLFDWFSALPNEIKASFGVATAVLAGLGTALFLIGTIGLGLPAIIQGVGKAIGFLESASATGLVIVGNLGAMLGVGGLSGALLGAGVAVLGIIGLLYVFNDLVNNGSDYINQFSEVVGVVFGKSEKDFSGMTDEAVRFNREIQRYVELLPNAINLIITSVVNMGALFVATIKTMIDSFALLASTPLRLGTAFAEGGVEGLQKELGNITGEGLNLTINHSKSSVLAVENIGESYNRLIDAQKSYNAQTEKIITTTDKFASVNERLTKSLSKESLSGATTDYKSILDDISVLQDNYVSTTNEKAKLASKAYSDGLIESSSVIADGVTKGILNPIENNIGYLDGSPPTQGPLANTPKYASNFVYGFSDSLASASPYLNETITTVFTDATNIMESIVHSSVERVISDVNRALSALRSLESKKASVSSSNTTNNNQKVNVNVNGGNTSSVVSAVKRAVMV